MDDQAAEQIAVDSALGTSGASASTRWLLALMGAPGCGKSTFGRALGRHLNWPLLDKDDVGDLLDDTLPHVGGLAYDCMFNIARRQLLQGLSVICDSPFAYRRCYESAQKITQEAHASLAIIECRCPDEVAWRQRVETRQGLVCPGTTLPTGRRCRRSATGPRSMWATPSYIRISSSIRSSPYPPSVIMSSRGCGSTESAPMTGASLGCETRTSSSVGIALSVAGAIGPEEMLRAADAAMYHAKRSGGRRYAVAG